MREAVLHAVPWVELTEQIFPDQDVLVAVDVWEVGPMFGDAREVPHDPKRARVLLAEAGFEEGFHLVLLFSPEDEKLAQMAEWIAEALSNIGIQVELIEVPAADAFEVMAARIAAGESVLWLTR